MESTITIAGVETKTGETNGRAWKLYIVKAQDGTDFSTLDGGVGSVAATGIGQVARVTWELDSKGRHKLQGLTLTGEAPPPEPVRDRTESGATDWDLIGLRKTRCALWAAAISAGRSLMEARQLVVAAEADIFHRPPAQSLEDEIPF